MIVKLVETCSVMVDYDLSLVDAIRAGQYAWFNPGITEENFPSRRKGKSRLKVMLTEFDDGVKSLEVLRALDDRGLRAIELYELLGFGRAYPRAQLMFPIISLGSCWRAPNGFKFVPCLYEDSAMRDLDLDWWSFGWNFKCRFPAVRKQLRAWEY
jgi:hypothetical protein